MNEEVRNDGQKQWCANMTRLIGNRVEQCLNIADLRRAAARRAHRMVFDYIDGGADDEWTLDNNVRAFDRYELLYLSLIHISEPTRRS